MLKLCDIVKNYPTATTTVQALRGVSLAFRENEFVAILGPSGCGKTTMLNIIGGLDRYTSGDLIIGGVSTADFDDEHWDAYRNATIGFVFQSYNLIPHLTVLENVELALSLVGEKKKIRRAKAIAALRRVNMGDEINKRPNQLSGGQMQRVAIARAIVNDPKIILADEPTGALDSELSVQVMDILKEISKTRLVIMVTHNGDLAREYCSRICSFKDGHLIGDTNPYDPDAESCENEPSSDNVEEQERSAAAEQDNVEQIVTTDTSSLENEDINDESVDSHIHNVDADDEVDYANLFKQDEVVEVKQKKVSNRKRKKAMKHIDSERVKVLDKLGINSQSKKKHRKDKTFKPTSMSAGMAFGLSMRNLISKRNRTFFTAFAGSIGIIGLALVLSISNGFDVFVENMQTEMLAGVPLGIYQYNINDSAIMDTMLNMANKEDKGAYPEGDKIGVQNQSSQDGSGFIMDMMMAFFDGVTKNELTSEFADYMRDMPKEDYSAMGIYYGVRYNLVRKTFDESGNTVYLDASQVPNPMNALSIATTVLGENGLQTPNWQVAIGDEATMMESYDLIGENSRYPQNKNEILLCISENNQISKDLLDSFGITCYETDGNGNVVMGDDGKPKKIENLTSDYFIGQKIKLVRNDDYYVYDAENDLFEEPDSLPTESYKWTYTDQTKLEKMYNDSQTELEIVGVIRQKKHGSQYVGSALIYTQELAEYVLQDSYDSEVAKYQRAREDFTQSEGLSIFGSYFVDKDVTSDASIIGVMSSSLMWSSYLKCIGAIKDPSYISIYPKTYSQKLAIGKYIGEWSEQGKGSVGYFDVSEMFIYNLNMIIDLVSVMLIAVASISLVVSTVMIGVITSNSVIERTREIGILRSLGARKLDIRHVFIAETSIIGLCSGIMGIVIAYVLCPIISAIINAVAGFPNLLRFHPLHALLLVVLSLVLTVISGIIPAISASRKNVVDALRVE